MLLHQEDERNLKMHVKTEPQGSPSSLPDGIETTIEDKYDDDGIPVIKTKIGVVNRSSKNGGPMLLSSFKEDEQFDPFLLPMNSEANGENKKMENVDMEVKPDIQHQRSPPIPYSVEDL